MENIKGEVAQKIKVDFEEEKDLYHVKVFLLPNTSAYIYIHNYAFWFSWSLTSPIYFLILYSYLMPHYQIQLFLANAVW